MMTWMIFASVVVLAVAFLGARLLHRAPAATRHAVWTVALTLLLALPAFEMSGVRIGVPVPASWLEAEEVWPEVGGASTVATTPLVTEARFPAAAPEAAPDRAGSRLEGVGVGRRSTPRASVADRVARGDVSSQLRDEFADAGAVGSGEASSSRADVARDHRAEPSFGWADVVLIVWALGSFGLLGSVLLGHVAAWRLTTVGVGRASPRVGRQLAATCVRLGIRRPIRLVVSPTVRVPATWGLRKPTIVLPPESEEWSADFLERVFLHELAHIQRGDCWSYAIAECARAIHWPNPLVWVAARRQRVESEHACDDLVLRRGQAASAYAADLLNMVRALSPSAPLPEASMAMARPAGIGQRVRAVLDPEQRRGEIGRLAVVGLGAATVLTAFLVTALTPVAAAQDAASVLPAPEVTVAEPLTPEPAALPVTEPAVVTLPHAAAMAEPEAPVFVRPEPAMAPTPPISERGRRLPSPDVFATGRSSASRFESLTRPAWTPPSSPVRQRQSQELCVFQSDRNRSTNVNSNDDGMKIRWETRDCRLEIEIEGEIVFAADDRSIESMERDALFEIEERADGIRRRARLEGTSGGIERRFWVDGDEVAWGAEADAWLASALPEIFRHTTLHAEARVERMLASGGPDRVFQEASQIPSDHVLRRYLELMMEAQRLSEGEYTRVLEFAAEIDSDHGKGELLLAVVEAAGLRPAFQQPMLHAAESIESDHQKTRVLQALLTSDLSPAQLDAVAQSAMTIESDHNLGQVLNGILDSGPLGSAELTRVLEMTDGLDSDHQRGSILQRIGAEYELDRAQIGVYLRSAASLDSDHQVATTTEAIIGRDDFGPEHLALVLTMADVVDSDHQRTMILNSVVLREELSARELDEVLSVARGMDSDHQLASTLSLVLEDETLNGEGILAVLEAAEGLDSSHQRSMVLLNLARIYRIDGAARDRYLELTDDLSRHDRDRARSALRR